MEQDYRPSKDLKDATVIKSSTTTSAGNVGGTTLVDTILTQANDYWNNMAVLILSGNSTGQIRRISDFDAATDTVTVDTAFASQIASGTKYMIIALVEAAAGGGDATAANQVLILADTNKIDSAALSGTPTANSIARYLATGGTSLGTELPASKSLYDGLSGGINAVNRVAGKIQILEVSVTSAANAGDVTLATVTTQACLIKSLVIHADTAQTSDLTTCAVTGGASKVITFIGTSVATQSNLNAIDKQVAWTGAVRLAATKTIVMSLAGTGATAVDLTVTIEYEACTNGGYLT